MSKIFAVYKPKGPTSYDIVEEIKKITGEKKVGHAGTLDPLARGVLVVAVGREATKKLGQIVKKEKEYLAKIKLGVKSATDDEEGEKTEIKISRPPFAKELRDIIGSFEGEIMQIPPLYSAVKIKGKEAYKYARKGKYVKLEPRKAKIKKIDILKYGWPYLELKVVTGSGVYIRSLARDIGKKLNVGGYLADLERTRVGDFTKEKALSMHQIENFLKNL